MEQVGQNAGDAEGKGYTEERHANHAGTLSGYSIEGKCKAEAGQQGKKLQETQVTSNSFHNGSSTIDCKQNSKHNSNNYPKDFQGA